MAFNDELRHKLLFDKVKNIYQHFQSWQEYNPYVCDPQNVDQIKGLSEGIQKKLDSIIQNLDDLHSINVDSYGC